MGRGPDRRWNIFEFMLVGFAILEIPITIVQREPGNENSSTTHPTLILLTVRVLKLGRIARIVRIIKLPLFKDLVKMLNGAVGGIKTLFWSVVLIMVPLYMMALVLRDSLGNYA